jgi:hypothetical protein
MSCACPDCSAPALLAALQGLVSDQHGHAIGCRCPWCFARAVIAKAERAAAARFEKTYCSQCGGEFGPGDSGYSHCRDHQEAGR